ALEQRRRGGVELVVEHVAVTRQGAEPGERQTGGVGGRGVGARQGRRGGGRGAGDRQGGCSVGAAATAAATAAGGQQECEADGGPRHERALYHAASAPVADKSSGHHS